MIKSDGHGSNYIIMWVMQNCRSFRIYLP